MIYIETDNGRKYEVVVRATTKEQEEALGIIRIAAGDMVDRYRLGDRNPVLRIADKDGTVLRSYKMIHDGREWNLFPAGVQNTETVPVELKEGQGKRVTIGAGWCSMMTEVQIAHLGLEMTQDIEQEFRCNCSYDVKYFTTVGGRTSIIVENDDGDEIGEVERDILDTFTDVVRARGYKVD